MARFRLELAILLSFFLTLAVIFNAFYHRKQFYPSVVYLTKSNSSMAILYLQAFVIALMIGKLMNKVFFGQLRAIELEHLFERSWYAITETCLAFTVFRDDFSPKFVTMFTLLLFLKCFHWLAEDRIDYMERSPVITLLFHLRMLSLMGLLMIFDFNFVYLAYNHTLAKGASVQLVFGFEYAILLVNVISTFIRYILHTIDIQNESPWENKGIYMLYGDLVLGFFRVVLYLTFMTLMIKIHTFPLFAIRPMYLSLRSFKKSLNDVIMSRRAIRNLNNMYPDVTAEQLRNYSDTICIICREEMASLNDSPIQQIKKLPCDHIFHKSCLRSWFQRQQTCPTCRTSILRFSYPNQEQPGQQQQPQQQPQNNINNLGGGIGNQNNNQAPHQAPTQSTPQRNENNFRPFSNTRYVFNSNNNAVNNNNHQSSSHQHENLPNINHQFGFLPPFAFMPPPLPPLNLTQELSIEELTEMEGNERHNVEARIHCLRNINVMLNASMVQMQQYMNICAATSHLDNINRKKTSSSIENDLKYVNRDAESVANSKLSEKSQVKKEVQKIVKNEELICDKNEFEKLDEVCKTVISSQEEENKIEENVENDGLDSIRKRRLEHFESSTSANTQ